MNGENRRRNPSLTLTDLGKQRGKRETEVSRLSPSNLFSTYMT